MEQTDGNIGRRIEVLCSVCGIGWVANVSFSRLGKLVHVSLFVLRVALLNFELAAIFEFDEMEGQKASYYKNQNGT